MSFKIYPNPVNNYLTIEFKSELEESYEFTVYNTMGNKVLSKSIAASGKFDLSDLAKGVYYISIQSFSNNMHKNFKIIKRNYLAGIQK